LNLQALAEQPFELLLELERRARGGGGGPGAERFVTSRADVREVIPVPDPVTRVPGAKPWLRGIANLRGQLLTVVDLKSFLGGGGATTDRQARVLIVASREVPTGLIVDEVVGFRRFGAADYHDEAPPGITRCEHYLEGCYRRSSEVWPRFSLLKLLEDQQFLTAGETVQA